MPNPTSKIPTPNLDALADEGMRFEDAHSNSAVCTPTRYGILTGWYSWRTRLKSGVLWPPDDPPLIKPDRLTLAGIKGYNTDVHRANYMWRGTKTDIWEGGHRVPFIVRWPGKIQAGSTSSETICLTDVMATVADIVGYSLGENEGEDSFSFLPLLSGENLKQPRPPVVHHSYRGMFALREGKWKMVFGNGSGGPGATYRGTFCQTLFLV